MCNHASLCVCLCQYAILVSYSSMCVSVYEHNGAHLQGQAHHATPGGVSMYAYARTVTESLRAGMTYLHPLMISATTARSLSWRSTLEQC